MNESHPDYASPHWEQKICTWLLSGSHGLALLIILLVNTRPISYSAEGASMPMSAEKDCSNSKRPHQEQRCIIIP